EGASLARLGGEVTRSAARDAHPAKEGRRSRGPVRAGAEGPLRDGTLAPRELRPSDDGPAGQERAVRDGAGSALVLLLDRSGETPPAPGLRERQVGEGDLERERRSGRRER